jgi:hypothetical protein
MSLRVLFIVVLGFILAACETAPPPATDQEKDKVENALFACLHDAIRRTDDHRSDAGTIAIAVMGMCGSQFTAVDETQFRDKNLELRAMLARNAWDRQLKIATAAVLTERKISSQ